MYSRKAAMNNKTSSSSSANNNNNNLKQKNDVNTMNQFLNVGLQINKFGKHIINSYDIYNDNTYYLFINLCIFIYSYLYIYIHLIDLSSSSYLFMY